MENTTLTKHWLISTCWEDLAPINEPAYNIAILQRQPCLAIAPCLETLTSYPWESISGLGTVEQLEKSLTQQLAMLGNELHVDTSALALDIINMAREFSKIAPSHAYRWRFAQVHSNMCTRYHADVNDLRLLCTYYGPGTLWLTTDNINIKALRKQDHNNLVIDLENVRQSKPFDITIMKGALHPENRAGALIHRSPTIEENGTTRILFRLDTATFWPL